PYEAPENSELVLDANTASPEELAEQVVQKLIELEKIG
ncbi:MAG TPA: adenylyl-sulfate kinase, partial [Planctomycetaceae bacterium]|nr:adenylyl-sulfate kinase [Planctomycetaceae bacterium]